MIGFITSYIYIYTNIHIQTMTNQLFCLATHLRLAMLCLQLGKSCWVLVLDSFFRHEEMSQLRFAEPLFSCHFSKRAIRLVTNCSMGGMVRPINMLGRWWWWWWWWWCLLCLQLLLYFSNYCYYIWLCCTVMTISTSCWRNGAFFWLRTSLFGTSVGCPVVLWRCLERIQHCQTWFHGTNIQRIYFLRYI